MAAGQMPELHAIIHAHCEQAAFWADVALLRRTLRSAPVTEQGAILLAGHDFPELNSLMLVFRDNFGGPEPAAIAAERGLHLKRKLH